MEGWDPTDKSWADDDAAWPSNSNIVRSIKVERSDDSQLSAVSSHMGNDDAGPGLAGECSGPTQSHNSAHQASTSSLGSTIKVEQQGACQMPAAPSQPPSPNEQVESRHQDEIKPQVLSTDIQSRVFQSSEKPPPSSGSTTGTKRKQVHMDALDCSDLAQTEPGAMALTNPAVVRKSSLDSNKGLYPVLRPSRSLSQGNPQLQYVSPRTKKPSLRKFALSEKEMKSQSRIDSFITVSPRKKAATDDLSSEGKQCPGVASPTPSIAGHSSPAAASPFPKKNLNTQFATMGPSQSLLRDQVLRNTLPTHQQHRFAGPLLSHSASFPSSGTTRESNVVIHPPSQRTPTKEQPTNHQFSHQFRSQTSLVGHSPQHAFHPSSPGSVGRTVTKLYGRQCQSPCPSPAKSSKSTVESDIEEFMNDNSLDGVDFDLALTPPGPSPSKSVIHPPHQGTPIKEPPTKSQFSPQFQSQSSEVKGRRTKTSVYGRPNQSPCPSPAKSSKSTMESDIEEFMNNNSLDGVDFDLASTPPEPSPSKSVKSTVDEDMQAFENDSYFDSIDPELLDEGSVQSQPSTSQPQASNPPDTFGLLGDGPSPGCSESDGDDPRSVHGFDSLPLEVLERIFCFVPMMDIKLHLSLVCKRWNEIISKEDFMPWKKAYNRLRLNSLRDVPDQLNLISGDLETTEDTCLLALVRSMPKFKGRYSSSMDRDLQKHPKYDLAKDIMKSRAPELIENEAPNPWSTVCLLVLLSETVQDVSRILTFLLHQTASCTTMEVMECLYCIAAYLWKYRMTFKLNGGCHYRVYHALYLFENSHAAVPLPSEGSSDHGAVSRNRLPRHSMPPTHEQWRIINHDIERGKVVKIVAFAGTGKTSTLVKYAERRPDTSFLYVAFNKSVQTHATDIFPKNVTSKTTHSLAYNKVGFKYKNKLQASLNPFFVHKLLPARKHNELHWLRNANLVCKTIQRFCASADDYITTRHVPAEYSTYTQNGDVLVQERHYLDHTQKMQISNDASAAWDKMINEKNKEAKITHDVYLKLFQLKKPWYLDYDCILIDEAQDLTPAQQDILLNQPGSKILVGDPNQQIYSFRGATDAMRQVECETTLHLTQSFRFGTEIAYIANCLLERASRNSTGTKQMLIGTREPGRIDGEEVGKVAIITRSNITLFSEAVKIVEADNTTMLAFAGGIDRYGMDVILDIYQLLQPENKRGFIKNKYIYTQKNLPALKKYATDTENKDLLNKIRIAEMYNVRIPELIEKIRSRTKPETMADIVLSTAHQAKGLEFDTVKIADDFGISEARLSPLVVVDKDELNMVYVAITRARKSLVLNNSLMKFIGEQPTWEKFAYPAPAMLRDRVGSQDPNICVECREQIPGNCVMLLRKNARKVAYPTVSRAGGLLCLECSLQMYPALHCILG
ncbi:F-box DNA helicase 1-like [Patiria miniata]|uniref:DNA 3'-5' helicase n=1 Tax=Patiria miniata TaxID=46514 RepID=A0A914AUR0_PATMI|nr:F-box DNA helicase 1-like [Patiria miniata]